MDLTKLNELMQSLPGYALLSDTMKTSAMETALIPDSNGVWPQQPGYVDTYDIYFAAVSLLPFLAAQPVVTSASSEGTSVSAKPLSWADLRKFYQGLSPILSGNSILTLVPIPDVPHIRRVPMNDRGGYFGDVDTDLG